MYYRWRTDDPNLGRFNSRDPIGYRAGWNLYSYVSNRPCRFFDPFGLDSTTQENIKSVPEGSDGIGVTIIGGNTTSTDLQDWQTSNVGGTIYPTIKTREDFFKSLGDALKKAKKKCIQTLNVSGHAGGVGATFSLGGWTFGVEYSGLPVPGLGDLNPDGLGAEKLLTSLLCPDAVINICSCGYLESRANRKKFANAVQRKVCSCSVTPTDSGSVTGACDCHGKWECAYPDGKDETNYGK